MCEGAVPLLHYLTNACCTIATPLRVCVFRVATQCCGSASRRRLSWVLSCSRCAPANTPFSTSLRMRRTRLTTWPRCRCRTDTHQSSTPFCGPCSPLTPVRRGVWGHGAPPPFLSLSLSFSLSLFLSLFLLLSLFLSPSPFIARHRIRDRRYFTPCI